MGRKIVEEKEWDLLQSSMHKVILSLSKLDEISEDINGLMKSRDDTVVEDESEEFDFSVDCMDLVSATTEQEVFRILSGALIRIAGEKADQLVFDARVRLQSIHNWR